MQQSRYFSDVSNNNSRCDVQEYAHWGRVLLAHKVTEGATFVDGTYAARVRWAHARGLTVLHYHFARPDEGNDPTTEAAHFARHMRGHLAPGDYVCLDIERLAKGRRESLQVWAERFCVHLHGLVGHWPIIYSGESLLTTELRGLKIPGERYWVAKYGQGPANAGVGRRVWAWQFTDGAVGPLPHDGPGIGACDNSILPRRMGWLLRARTLRRRRGGAHKAS